MNKNKKMYLSPETEVLVVRFEDSLLNSGSPDGTWNKAIKNGSTWDTSDTDDYGLE